MGCNYLYLPFLHLALCLSFVISMPPSSTAQPADSEKKSGVPRSEQLKLLKVFSSEFVRITPGEGKFPKSALIGSETGGDSEKPVHKVTFEYKFSIAKYEVPQNLYEAVMGNNPSRWKGPRNSVEMFTWQDANLFCQKITRLMIDAKLIEADKQIRLPTEAEWEYCCRAGTATAYSFGDMAQRDGDEGKQASILDDYAWHTGNAEGYDPPVGAKKPNAWGLYDAHGYLWEFVADGWHETYKGSPIDGSGWVAKPRNSLRVIRGGSWKDRYEKLRSAHRAEIPANTKSDTIGLRCVKAKISIR